MNNFNNAKYKGNGLTNNGNTQQQQQQDEDDLFAAPIQMGGLGSAQKWKGVTRSAAAPTMFDTHGLSQISGPQPMAAKQQQTVIKSQVMIAPNSAFGGLADLDTTPISFGNPMANKLKPQLMVLPNIGSAVAEDFSEFKREPIVFVPSKCLGNGLEAAPAVYNEFQSIVVDETPKQCLAKFASILDAFSNDISYEVDAVNHVINGQIFINHLAVFFKISIWTETANADNARFEFRRSKGDAVAFAEFWNEIETIIYSQFGNAKGPKTKMQNNDDDSLEFGGGFGGGLPAMDYNFDLDLDLDADSQVGFSNEDLDNIVAEIQEEDPFVVMSIAMLLDAFQAQSKFIQMILNHAQFIDSILQKALQHNDLALVRAALVTLERVCESEEGVQTLIALNALDRIVPLLGSANDLIRKYTVRLMAKLSTVSAWTFSNLKLKKYAQMNVAECESKWENCRFATNDFIESKMFKNINAALIKAN